MKWRFPFFLKKLSAHRRVFKKNITTNSGIEQNIWLTSLHLHFVVKYYSWNFMIGKIIHVSVSLNFCVKIVMIWFRTTCWVKFSCRYYDFPRVFLWFCFVLAGFISLARLHQEKCCGHLFFIVSLSIILLYKLHHIMSYLIILANNIFKILLHWKATTSISHGL